MLNTYNMISYNINLSYLKGNCPWRVKIRVHENYILSTEH